MSTDSDCSYCKENAMLIGRLHGEIHKASEEKRHLVEENQRLLEENQELKAQLSLGDGQQQRVSSLMFIRGPNIQDLLDENKQLRAENRELREKVQLLEATVNKLEAKERERSEKETQTLLLYMAADIIGLYGHYFCTSPATAATSATTPLVRTCNAWGSMCEEVADIIGRMEDGEISDAAAKDECKMVGGKYNMPADVSLVELLKFKDARNGDAHTDLRSAKNQSNFLDVCAATNWSPLGTDAAMNLQKVVEKLRTVKLARKK